MLRSLLCLMLALQSLTAALSMPQNRVVLAMKTGMVLRMHVVAQDDTEEMQRIKLVVRDAVRQAYDDNCPEADGSMLAATRRMLPELEAAAMSAALGEGYTDTVTVAIETLTFDERELDGYVFPAGEYPALMIRLGAAQGHNWWGLIDPELSLRVAMVPGTAQGGGVQWDWSLGGFWSALLGRPMGVREGNDA